MYYNDYTVLGRAKASYMQAVNLYYWYSLRLVPDELPQYNTSYVELALVHPRAIAFYSIFSLTTGLWPPYNFSSSYVSV